MPDAIALAILIFIAATLYSSVGHGGASGYLAAMALFSLAPDVMRPTALVLNIIVASIAAIQFGRTGSFSWQTFWPFAVTSIPLAFVGGAISLPPYLYRPALAAVLAYAAVRLLFYRKPEDAPAANPPIAPALLIGAGIGLLSGLTGVGGGIFLSPLLLFTRWATIRQTAGVSAAFIVVNSIAGIAGYVSRIQLLPADLWLWAPAALFGSLLGTTLGTRRFDNVALRRMLGVVLLIAAVKMIIG